MLRFIVCDADRKFCEIEKAFIEKFYKKIGLTVQVDIICSAEGVIGLKEKVTLYDAIFLDINMDRVNGLDVAEYLNGAAPDLFIIFVSGSLTYAPDAFKVGAVRYILKNKDVFYTSMEECLKFILRKAREGDVRYIQMKDYGARVSTYRVLYVDSKSHKITYHLCDLYGKEQSYSIYGKLDDAEKELSEHGFLRVHQSYLVNMGFVCGLKRYSVSLTDGKTVPVSKSRYKDVERAFNGVNGACGG